MKLSRESEYGIAALIYLAKQPLGTILQTAQVAEATGVPKPFLAKTFVKLVHENVLRSFRGKQRGYQLARDAVEISAKEMIEAIEGTDAFKRCIFWSERCSDENPCVLHNYWQHVRPDVIDLMENLSLQQLAKENHFVNSKQRD